MSQSSTLTVRIGAKLNEHVAKRVGEDGTYENVSEYVRDLIRRDKAQEDEAAFERLKAELQSAFSSPDENFVTLSAADIIARNRR
jgi:antitoxin ParD1/3/4